MNMNGRLVLSVLWVVLGILLLGLSMAGVLDSSYYSGFGAAFLVVGALQVWRNLKYRKDASYRQKVDTEEGDERNDFLRMKSWSYTGLVVVFIEAVGVVVTGILGQEAVQQVLSGSVCLICLVYWVTYMILSRRY